METEGDNLHGTPPKYSGSFVSVEETPACPIPGRVYVLSTSMLTTFLALVTENMVVHVY